MSILVAGSLHLDVVVRAPHLPALDETVTGDAVDYVFGGKGGNQALAAARMGADVRFAGRAGSDAFGDMLRAVLDAGGLDISMVQRDAGPSGMSAAIVDAQGDYGAVIVSAANLNIDVAGIEVAPDVTVVVLQNEVPNAVNLEIARKAKHVGAQVWLNAAPARDCPAALFALVDLLIVNRVEAAFYEGSECEMLTTRGSEGVVFQGQSFAAFPVKTVSTHGAGDMFVGALAARVGDGASITQAIPFAQAAAALHVAADLETRAALDAAQVVAFLEDQSSR